VFISRLINLVLWKLLGFRITKSDAIMFIGNNTNGDKTTHSQTICFIDAERILNAVRMSFDKINVNTIKKDLQYLKKENIIQSVGKGKGTIYISE